MCLWIRDRAGHMPHDTSQITNDRTRAAEHIQQVAYNRTLARTQIYGSFNISQTRYVSQDT